MNEVHCQICARPIKAAKGLIAHHGYMRPQRGSGWQTASCMGARFQPYEVACDRLPVAIKSITEHIERQEAYLKTLVHGVAIPNPQYRDWLTTPAYRKRSEVPPPPTVVPDGEQITMPDGYTFFRETSLGYGRTYKSELANLIHSTTMDINASRETLKFFEQRLADWKEVNA